MAVKAKIYTWKIPSLLVQITEITWCSSSRIQHQSHSTSGKNTSKSPPKAVLTPSILSPHVWTGSKELPIQTKTTVQVLTDKKELQAIQVKSVQDEEHKGYNSTSFFSLQLPWAEVQITGKDNLSTLNFGDEILTTSGQDILTMVKNCFQDLLLLEIVVIT